MTRRRLGTLAALWAGAYVPVHVYWALGGATEPFGLAVRPHDWALANWAACVLVTGAGLLGPALTRDWGAGLAGRRGVAYVAGSIALAHWAVFSVQLPLDGLDRWGWWNLLVFEPWFAVMGVLLIRGARLAAGRGTGGTSSRAGAVLLLAGVAATVGGVVVLVPWVFLGVGPVLTFTGGVVSYLRTTHDDAHAGRAATRPRETVAP